MLTNVAIGCLAVAVIVLTFVCYRQQKNIEDVEEFAVKVLKNNVEMLDSFLSILIESAKTTKKTTKKTKGEKK